MVIHPTNTLKFYEVDVDTPSRLTCWEEVSYFSALPA